jgi:hypothetical protein
MTIPERVKDILEEIAVGCHNNPHYCRLGILTEALATEALKIIAEGGNFSDVETKVKWKRVIIDGKDGFIKVEFEKPSYENENPFNDGYGP